MEACTVNGEKTVPFFIFKYQQNKWQKVLLLTCLGLPEVDLSLNLARPFSLTK